MAFEQGCKLESWSQNGPRPVQQSPSTSLVGLPDRALIGVVICSFARLTVAVGMDVEDLVQTAGRSWLRLHEKGGKVHEMPAQFRHQNYHLPADEGTLELAQETAAPSSPRTTKLHYRRGDQNTQNALIAAIFKRDCGSAPQEGRGH